MTRDMLISMLRAGSNGDEILTILEKLTEEVDTENPEQNVTESAQVPFAEPTLEPVTF